MKDQIYQSYICKFSTCDCASSSIVPRLLLTRAIKAAHIINRQYVIMNKPKFIYENYCTFDDLLSLLLTAEIYFVIKFPFNAIFQGIDESSTGPFHA